MCFYALSNLSSASNRLMFWGVFWVSGDIIDHSQKQWVRIAGTTDCLTGLSHRIQLYTSFFSSCQAPEYLNGVGQQGCVEVELSEAAREAALRTVLTGAQSEVRLGEQTHAKFLQEAAAWRVQAGVPATKKMRMMMRNVQSCAEHRSHVFVLSYMTVEFLPKHIKACLCWGQLNQHSKTISAPSERTSVNCDLQSAMQRTTNWLYTQLNKNVLCNWMRIWEPYGLNSDFYHSERTTAKGEDEGLANKIIWRLKCNI